MLLTDGWWGGRVTKNTSITAGGRKTVKQNQSHMQLAGSRCARWGLHVHPQQTLSNLSLFFTSNLLHTRTSPSRPLLPSLRGQIMGPCCIHFSAPSPVRDLLAAQEPLSSHLPCVQAACRNTWFYLRRGQKALLFPKPPIVARVQLQLPAVKTRKQLKLAPS